MRKRIQIMIGIWLLCLCGCGGHAEVYLDEAGEAVVSTEMTAISDDTDSQKQIPENCYVYVCGAVVSPGVYELPAGSRIYQAIKQAQGLTKEACADSINQAEEVTDGQMIKVLTKEEAAEEEVFTSVEETDGRININTADAAMLMTLPGIGASKADSIISYREEHGGFSAVEDIMKITGIKEGIYTKIKDHITVN